MAETFVKSGCTLTMTAPSGGATAGVGILIGELFGVALTTAVEGASFEMATEGVFTLAKTDSLAIAPGAVVYWDDSAKCVNKTTTNKEVGRCVKDVAVDAGLVTANVFLTPTARASVAV